ncbi:DUF2845 domain-containing protein [Ferrimonas marina]|uniref:DUF2845 domain-containing protein n=1 Tax=Ferrimonas marina TaxID=299255 RepID=UPI0013566982|nr:DUF2845 domain-containing protein [Ferrimonas marina]
MRCTATGLIKVGDSTGALLSACGRPQLTESLQYPEGGVASTRYYFRVGGKEAFVAEVRAGEVVALRRMR